MGSSFQDNIHYSFNGVTYEDVAIFSYRSPALDRPSDPGGKTNWVAALESAAQTRADLLIGFSESAENYQATIGLIRMGLEYPIL